MRQVMQENTQSRRSLHPFLPTALSKSEENGNVKIFESGKGEVKQLGLQGNWCRKWVHILCCPLFKTLLWGVVGNSVLFNCVYLGDM